MELSTTMYGLKISLDTDMDGTPDEPVSGCWIAKDGFSASLECLDATGALQEGDDEMPVPVSTIVKIRRWAEANGY